MTAPPADEAALDSGRRLFAREIRFIGGVVDVDGIPDSELPEIAFAGRSNVGKSSLLNALTGRRNLARTSNTPGRTQQLNFFDLSGRLMLVDLPGYGYARAPRKQVRDWTALIHTYLKGRPNLRRVCLLIDSRHGPKPNDISVMNELDEAAVAYQIVLTKSDKLGADALESRLADTARDMAGHVACHPNLIATSAAKGTGIAALRASLAILAEAT